MLCGECGTSNSDDARFCVNCGASLSESAEIKADATGGTSPRGKKSDSLGNLGPYELRGELGRGAMAVVWRAWDPNLEREVAIKEPMFDPRLSQNVLEEMGRRFVREGKAAARLDHPGIVTIYAADVYDGRPAIVMELVEGATLGQMLKSGPLAPAEALDVLDQLLDAIGYAHDHGVVHRDIKPDNIFVNTDGRVKLADFGIAHVDDGAATRATMVGTVLGTPGYMSPEQATGAEVDARSDLFSIATVAYEMLTGRNPFGAGEGTDSTTLLYRIVHEPAAELPAAASEGLPEDLRPAIMLALSKDPLQRPQNAAAFKTMLHGGKVPVAKTGSKLGKAAASASRSSAGLPKWLPYIAVAIAGVIIVLVLIVSATSSNNGGTVGTVTGGTSTSDSTSVTGQYYLGVSDDHVAVYDSEPNSGAQPLTVSDVSVSDLDSTVASQLGAGMPFASLDEANARVDEYRQEIEDAEAEAKAKAKAKKEAAKSEYIIPTSATKRLKKSDLANYTYDELSKAQNEIWARHHRRFQNKWLQRYFDKQSWYTGTISAGKFNSVYKGTKIENYNSKLISDYLDDHGYNVFKVHPN